MMSEKWDGVERRGEQKQLGFCPAHIEQVSDMAVIKNSLLNIEKTLTENTSFKTGMVFSIIGIVFSLVIQIVIFAYLYGGLCKQVQVNTQRWEIHDTERNDVTKQLEQMRIELRNPNIYKSNEPVRPR